MESMHEMSLAEGVIRIVEEAFARSDYRRVTAVRLEIGALSAVEPEALSFCFEAVARGTVADGARLEIEKVPGAGWCLQCSRTVPIVARYDACPHCGQYRVQPTAGAEMRVKDIEVA